MALTSNNGTTNAKKGIFLVVSVFVMMLALFAMSSLLYNIQTQKKNAMSGTLLLSTMNEKASNLGYIAGKIYSSSGRSVSRFGDYVQIIQDDNLSSNLDYNLNLIVSLTNFTNSSLSISDKRRVYFGEQQAQFIYFSVPNTTINVNTTYLHIGVHMSCTNLSSSWSSRSSGNRNVSVYVDCTNSGSYVSVLDSIQSGILNVTDSGETVISIDVNDRVQIMKYRGAYLNMITKMNETSPAGLNGSISVSRGSANKNSILWMDGYVG
ncbi:MAG: hypothetical protein ABII22_00840 [Candidatus Micrarchaeota archaeon]